GLSSALRKYLASTRLRFSPRIRRKVAFRRSRSPTGVTSRLTSSVRGGVGSNERGRAVISRGEADAASQPGAESFLLSSEFILWNGQPLREPSPLRALYRRSPRIPSMDSSRRQYPRQLESTLFCFSTRRSATRCMNRNYHRSQNNRSRLRSSHAWSFRAR